jgi:hypothetical protein
MTLTLDELDARRCGRPTRAGGRCRLFAAAPGEPCWVHGPHRTCAGTTVHGWPCRTPIGRHAVGAYCMCHDPDRPRRSWTPPTDAEREARRAEAREIERQIAELVAIAVDGCPRGCGRRLLVELITREPDAVSPWFWQRDARRTALAVVAAHRRWHT